MSELICPCDEIVHPRSTWNPPKRATLDYRVGDFTAFRDALLRPRPNEGALAEWQPAPTGDLVLQLLEWWAYLADVLVFYNERALHEVLLRTAVFPDDIRRVIRLLGYRPRPGIAATGVVAAILDSPRPVPIPLGFPIQGSLASGKPPQIFEVDADVELGLLGKPLPNSARFPAPPSGRTLTWTGYSDRDTRGSIVNALPARAKRDKKLPNIKPGEPAKVAVRGAVTNVGPNDTVLLLKRDWNGDLLDQLPGRALAVVHTLETQWDERGMPVTVLTLHPGQTLPAGAERAQYRLLKATKLSHLWTYHERYPGSKTPSVGGTILQVAEQIFDPLGLFSGGISREPAQDPHALTSMQMENPLEGAAHLEAITRGISPGDPVLFEQRLSFPGGLPELFAQMIGAGDKLAELTRTLEQHVAFLVKVTGYTESIWYANPPELDRIGQGPPIGPPSSGLLSGGASPIPIPHSKITFHDPFFRASMMSMDDLQIKTVVVHYAWQEVGELVDVPSTGPTTTPEVPEHPAVPPGAALPVVIEDVTGAGVPGFVGTSNADGESPPLVGALQALLHLLPVSRGQTVANEVLGSGESILVNQEFMLKQSPLTYLTDAQAPNGYRSTLRIRVSGVEWHEVASFFEQPPHARVFVTREDDQQRTFVRFGDGEHGARLPTGVDNVIATYRCGSGAEVPPIGALTTILKPQKGLQSLRNPIPPGGGADPDPPEQIRKYAPRSVLAFGRAISGDDYETIAAQTPGVRRAKAIWGWDATAQRSMVKVYVGDDEPAVIATRDALRAVSDPNRPVLVALAAPIDIAVAFTLQIDPDYEAAAVSEAVRTALLEPESEPFGIDVAKIGEVLYDSEIYDACLRVPGVIAVHDLQLRRLRQQAQAIRMKSVQGFRKHYPMWGVLPGIKLETVTKSAFAPAPPQSIKVIRPLQQPLSPQMLDRIAQATAIWNQRVEDTHPAPPPTAPVEIWDLDAGERHAPGEGRFYLLRGDRLTVATEVSRHGR